jgi:SAM-dependent methyltransferase
MDDPEAYRAASRAGWGQAAAAWAQYTPTHMRQAMPVTAAMLDAAVIQPGASLLELAAGTGEVGYMALELAQPGGTLITSDFAPEMLTAAQERAAQLGVRDVRFKQIDIESIDLHAGSLDVVLCRRGLMFAADPVAAVRECRRVLRQGGRLSAAVWTGPEENRWSSAMADELVQRGHVEPLPPGTPGQFALADPDRLAEVLREGGFVDDVAIDDVAFAFRESFDDWWTRTTTMARTASQVLSGLGAEERDAIRDGVRGRLAEFEVGGELTIPARCWIAAATA